MAFTILQLINLIFTIYLWSLLIMVIASWLITFQIINPYQPMVRAGMRLLYRVHEPILAPIRQLQNRLIPNSGGLDLSPIVAILLAQLLVLPLLSKLVISIFP
jgi:YggT family protein